MRSVTVGTSTCARLDRLDQLAPALIGLSSTLRRASNSSRMRVSTASGSLRVTMTRGFLAVSAWRYGLYAMVGSTAGRRACRTVPRVRHAPCLTDGHGDDKMQLMACHALQCEPDRSRPGCRDLISRDKSCFGLQNEARRCRKRLCAERRAPVSRGGRAGARACHGAAARAGGAAQARRPRRRRRQRTAGAALRQPEIRPRQPAPGSRHRVSHRLGLPACRPAGRGHQGIRGLAAGARRGGHRGLGARRHAERPAHGGGAAVGDARPGRPAGRGRAARRRQRERHAPWPRWKPACSPASSAATGAGAACRSAASAATSSRPSSGAPTRARSIK